MSPRLLVRRNGSLEGLAGSFGAGISSGGNHGQEEIEDGSNCEAAPHAAGEEEDLPPTYAEMVGAGAGIQFSGEGTFV